MNNNMVLPAGPKNNVGFPYVWMVFCNVVYAGMILFSKAVINKGMNPYVFGVYRQAFATIALAPFAFFMERNSSAPLSLQLIGKIFFVAFVGITVSINLLNLALSYIPATLVTATANAIPAITFIMAIVLRMERISIKQWYGVAKVLGTALSVAGALVFGLVKGPPLYATAVKNNLLEPSKGHNAEWIKGFLIIISAQTAWALWMILQEPIVKQYPDKLRLTTLQCFFGCIQSVVWAVAAERNLSSWKLGWNLNLLAVLYSGVIFTGLTYWLRVWVIEKRGPVFASVFTPVALVITTIFSACVWKEIPHWGSIGGGFLLVAGLFTFLWGEQEKGKPSKPVESNSKTSTTQEGKKTEPVETETRTQAESCV